MYFILSPKKQFFTGSVVQTDRGFAPVWEVDPNDMKQYASKQEALDYVRACIKSDEEGEINPPHFAGCRVVSVVQYAIIQLKRQKLNAIAVGDSAIFVDIDGKIPLKKVFATYPRTLYGIPIALRLIDKKAKPKLLPWPPREPPAVLS